MERQPHLEVVRGEAAAIAIAAHPSIARGVDLAAIGGPPSAWTLPLDEGAPGGSLSVDRRRARVRRRVSRVDWVRFGRRRRGWFFFRLTVENGFAR
jgi:hypothetical protein